MLHGRLVLEGAIGCGDERTVRTALAEAEAHGGELAGPVAALTKYADALYKEAVLDMRSLMRHGAGVEKLDQALAKYGEYDAPAVAAELKVLSDHRSTLAKVGRMSRCVCPIKVQTRPR